MNGLKERIVEKKYLFYLLNIKVVWLLLVYFLKVTHEKLWRHITHVTSIYKYTTQMARIKGVWAKTVSQTVFQTLLNAGFKIVDFLAWMSQLQNKNCRQTLPAVESAKAKPAYHLIGVCRRSFLKRQLVPPHCRPNVPLIPHPNLRYRWIHLPYSLLCRTGCSLSVKAFWSLY